MIEILRADYDDVAWVVKRMRLPDVLETYALGRYNHRTLMIQAWLSRISYVLRDSGRPVAIFGADTANRAWNVWMLCTPRFESSHGRAIKRHFHRSIVPQFLAEGADYVQAVSMEGHAAAHAFMEKLGGRRTKALERFGSRGETFYLYLWEEGDLRQISRPQYAMENAHVDRH